MNAQKHENNLVCVVKQLSEVTVVSINENYFLYNSDKIKKLTKGVQILIFPQEYKW